MSIDLVKRWNELQQQVANLEDDRNWWRSLAVKLGFLHLLWAIVIGYIL